MVGPPVKVKHGRGWTGKPRGRPPGSKNKAKDPDDGKPKVSDTISQPSIVFRDEPSGSHSIRDPRRRGDH